MSWTCASIICKHCVRLFEDPAIACVNFKVVEEGTGRLLNWVHHRSARLFADVSFDTYEITEGAAAFRRSSLQAAGGYPESFFLSHEGPDLAYRLMDRGWRGDLQPGGHGYASVRAGGPPELAQSITTTRATPCGWRYATCHFSTAPD